MLCPKVAMDMDCRTPLRVVSIGFVSSAYDRTCTWSGGGRGPSHPGGRGVGGNGKPGPPYFSTSLRVRCWQKRKRVEAWGSPWKVPDSGEIISAWGVELVYAVCTEHVWPVRILVT